MLKKLISSLCLVSIVFTQVFVAPVAYAQAAKSKPQNDISTIYDLVAVVVDTALIKDSSLEERILRYAEDLKNSNDYTDVRLVFYDRPKDSVLTLVNALENLYVNGDSTHQNRLSGVVLVGDIPLPVVNKGGNRFMSMFPYTDFEDKSYIFNDETQSFEINPNTDFPKAEIWHGLLRAPEAGTKGINALAEYFDKNHLYYEGDEDFAKFDKKLFYADLIREEESMTKDVYSYYQKYLAGGEDLVYQRYNKHWANELLGTVAETFEGVEFEPEAAKFMEALTSGSAFDQMPDIYSRNVIDQYLIPYYKMFTKYLSSVNDFTDSTGRYTSSDVDTLPALISMKDEYSRQYLKSVNDALEKKVNEVAEKISEPLTLLTSSKLKGEFTDSDLFAQNYDFEIGVSLLGNHPDQFDFSNPEELYMRYNYMNEETGDYYVNGIKGEVLENAKQCSVYLGSTKSDYFDENLAFNPKAVQGDYSILTRSIRSDNPSTAMPIHTVGVNTRGIAEAEAKILTNGAVNYGAVVEDNPKYGVPAFIDNPINSATEFFNPFESFLKKGDVVTRINGEKIDMDNPFGFAIENSYLSVKNVLDAINKKKKVKFPFEIAVAKGESFGQADANMAVGNMSIEYFRGDKKFEKNLTFSVNQNGLTSNSDAKGNPEIIVLLSKLGFPQDTKNYANSLFEAKSMGAIFTLYDTKNYGYDNSAGCNANSAGRNSDRCFYMLATMPVLDPAGSTEPIKTPVGGGFQLKFPEDIKKSDIGVNSSNAKDIADHMDMLQFPGGAKNDYYKFEEVDDVIYNSCFSGLPGLTAPSSEGVINSDSNPYFFPLYPNKKAMMDYDMAPDWYGRLLDGLGEFVDSSGKEPKSSPGKGTVWQNIDELNANKILLNDGDTAKNILVDMPTIRLSDFSSRYGLFDGKDNNGNGIRDYEWRDLKKANGDPGKDGVLDTKWYDYDEAKPIYGIPSWNLGEISRKLLSHNSTYTLPGYVFNPKFVKDIVLKVSVTPEKTVSSVIVHNEPTPYTLSQQEMAMGPMSLPIDNPRYVAFQTAPVPMETPKQSFEKELFTIPHYFPGKTKTIKYVNLFDTPNFAQLQANLDLLAWNMTSAYGSYRMLGKESTPVSCESGAAGNEKCKEIHDEILKKYFLPVIEQLSDYPESGFDLEKASTEKIYDALVWNSLNIDSKHEYVLSHYLDADEKAFINDSPLGYEAAYLVLDGEKDYFNLNFNKDIPEEKDAAFAPLTPQFGLADAGDGDGGSDGGINGGKEDDFQFVDLSQFLKEVQEFLDYFTKTPKLEQACVFSEKSTEEKEKAGSFAGAITSAPVSNIQISADKNLISATAADEVIISVNGFDALGNAVGQNSDGRAVTIIVNQSDSDPVLTLVDGQTKVLDSGSAVFKLRSTNNGGSAIIRVENDAGISSNSLTITSLNTRVEFQSYRYFVPDGMDDLLRSIEDGTFDEEFGVGVRDLSYIGNVGDFSDEVLNAKYDELFRNLDLAGGAGVSGVSGAGASGAGASGAGASGAGASGAGASGAGASGAGASGAGTSGAGASGAGASGAGASGAGASGAGVSGAGAGGAGVDGTTAGVDRAGDNAIDAGDIRAVMKSGSNNGISDASRIIILQSTPVAPKETEGVSSTPEVQQQSWQDYYFDIKYFEKFLNFDKEAVRYSRLIASVISDIQPFIDAKNEGSGYQIEPADSLVADLESVMMVRVRMLKGDGKHDKNTKHQVTFKIIDPKFPNMVSFVGGNVVESENGIATTYIKAGQRAGSFKIRAEVSGGQYPQAEKEFSLVAGNPVSIEIDSDYNSLVANSQSKIPLTFLLKDRFGNLANNTFAKLALFVDGKAYFDTSADTNPSIIGTQVETFEGTAQVDLFAKSETGKASVIALLLNYELEEEFLKAGDNWEDIDFTKYIGKSKKYDIYDKVQIKINSDKPSLLAGDNAVAKINVEILNNGKILDDYNGPINFNVVDSSFGTFVNKPPKNMKGGKVSEVLFKAGNKIGKAEILVTVPGFGSDTIPITISPALAYKIELKTSSDYVETSGKEVLLTALLLDKFGNLVNTDNTTLVNFGTSEATKDFVTFAGAKSALALAGEASTIIKANDVSGVANITASAAGLISGTASLKIVKKIKSKAVSDFNSRALYVSLLGGNFGDTMTDNNLAESFLFSGQVQAVSAVTANANGPKLMFGVDGFGKIDILSDTVSTRVVPATDSFPYQKVVVTDAVNPEQLSEVFVVPKVDTKVFLVDSEVEIPDEEGIYIKRISDTDKDMQFLVKNSAALFMKDGEAKIKVDKFGRIFVNDKNIELRLINDSDDMNVKDFTILAIYRGEILAQVTYKQNFADINGNVQNVKSLAHDSTVSSYSPGFYVKMSSSKDSYAFEQSYSGYSTNAPLGVYLVDKDSEILPLQAPGAPFTSVENAVETSGVGFEDSNKHMLLFTAGNSVGDSSVPYGSEIGVIYGDPNIKLNVKDTDGLVSKASGFTKDIGVPILTNQDSILDMIDFDFNGDGHNDVLLVYEDGYIRLLENEISTKRFRDKGYVLNIFGGILSASKIDVNNDGFDDLIVGTKEPCKKDEVCVSQFININGNLERSTLNLAIEDKVIEMKSEDINMDGCEDLVTSDLLANIRVFYNKTAANSCLGLETNHGNNFNFSNSSGGEDGQPYIHFDISKDFEELPKDIYPDIRVRPSINPSGKMTYLYSNGELNEKGYVKYAKKEVEGSGKSAEDLYNEAFKEQGLPDLDTLASTVASGGKPPNISDEAKKQLNKTKALKYKDTDGDGCIDSWDKAMSTYEHYADAVAAEINNIVDGFRCAGGGCLPIPYNYAFLAPNSTFPPSPGISLFAAGTPEPPYFGFFRPTTYATNSLFRLYLSPTLTMGLGTAVCAGPYPTALCFAQAIPSKFLGGCPEFLEDVGDAIAYAKEVSTGGDSGLTTIISDGSTAADSKNIEKSASVGGPKSPFTGSAKTNIRIPGFPSVLTNWIDKQTDEIFNKLLDFPDFYLIYPDVKSLVSDHAKSFQNFGNINFSSIQGVHDIMTAINSLPLVQIEGKEVIMKVPALSANEWAKKKKEWQQWLKYEEDQLSRIQEYWLCDENDNRKTFCDKFTVDLNLLLDQVRQLMDKLDKIVNLPTEFIKWRQLEAKYANQIICYLDAIMQYTGGYITKQQKIIQSWMKAAEDVIRNIKDWKIVLNLMADYQKSCDECKNDSFSKLGMLLSFFLQIPDPPIIALPKWPDVVFDMSQIKTGIKIQWPDIVFQPEPIVLPKLPTITLPEIGPEVKLDFSDFDFPDIPALLKDFPEFAVPDLPDLPPLPLPNLPDLPRPPKIPKLPNFVAKVSTTLKPIIKILCLLKKGLMPIQEDFLGTQIETLTQPSVSATLPFMKGSHVEFPSLQYDFVQEIRATAKLNFGIDTSYIYDVVKGGAELSNEKLGEFFDETIDKISEFPLQQYINNFVKNASDFANKKMEEGIDKGLEMLASDDSSGESSLPLSYIEDNLLDFNKFLNNYISEMEVEDIPDTYYLTATENFLDPSDPLLNRSIEEVERDIALENLPDTPAMRQLANVRDSLIVYAKNINKSNELLQNISEYDDLSRVLVDSDERLGRIASLTAPSFTGGSTEIQTGFFGSDMTELLDDAKRGLLAQAGETPYIPALDEESTPSGSPPGFYIIADGKNENILKYTKELGEDSHSVNLDVDSDGDFDILLSLRGDVYLKTNHKNEPKTKKGELVVKPLNSGVSDFVYEGGGSINGAESPYESHEKADVNWLMRDKDVKKYEIVVFKSIYDSPKEAFMRQIVEEGDTNISLSLPNGNYYGQIFGINADGKYSLPSETVLLSPQVCADKDPPFPSLGATDFSVSIFKSLQIDAGNSFDPEGEIKEYYLEVLPYENGDKPVSKLPKILWSDLNPIVDENSDGNPKNDKTNPQFNIGPFVEEGDIGTHKMKLHVVDQRGNSSAQEISIKVFVPKISLDLTFDRTGTASGTTNPKVPEMPFSLLRNRYIYRTVDGKLKLVPKLEKVITPSSVNGLYQTDINGDYSVSDFTFDSTLSVKDMNGNAVAKIDKGSGNIGDLSGEAEIQVEAAIPPSSPTKVKIVAKNGNTLATIYPVLDSNNDLSERQVRDLDLNDDIIVQALPANDSKYPGGMALVHKVENKYLAIIDTSGNIIILDKRISLSKKANDYHNDPMVIMIGFELTPVVEVHFNSTGTQIIGDKDVPFAAPRGPEDALLYPSSKNVRGTPFEDFNTLSDEMQRAVYDLYNKGVIDGVMDGGKLNVMVNDRVKRSEFVKILLEMLCIVPRPEAYKAYAPNEANGGFTDLKDTSKWYYPYIKEAALRGLVHGYKGELGADGLHPFKPDDTINLAESVKIIMEALEMQGVINLDILPVTDVWYEALVDGAINLTPYLKNVESLKNNYIIKPEDVDFAAKPITRGEMILMASRVLDLYNCFDGGLSDAGDAGDAGKKDQSAALGVGNDSDGDGLSDKAEDMVYKTDPNSADSDGGGVSDGDELNNLTDPLDPDDDGDIPRDPEDTPHKAGEGGVYIAPAECNSCPCEVSLETNADVSKDDIFFSVISTKDEKSILSKSEDRVYEK